MPVAVILFRQRSFTEFIGILKVVDLIQFLDSFKQYISVLAHASN